MQSALWTAGYVLAGLVVGAAIREVASLRQQGGNVAVGSEGGCYERERFGPVW